MAVGVLFTFRDGKGETSSTQVNLPSNTSAADAILFGQQMAGLLDALISGAITRVGIVLDVDISALGLNTTASGTSDVEEGARFQFRTANGFFTSMRIPTILEGIISSGGNSVNQVDVDVAAFLTAMETGIDLAGVGGTGTVAPVDTRNDDIVTTTSAKESFQSSRG